MLIIAFIEFISLRISKRLTVPSTLVLYVYLVSMYESETNGCVF